MPSSEPLQVEFAAPVESTIVDSAREDQFLNQSEKEKLPKGKSDETMTSVVVRDVNVEEGHKGGQRGKDSAREWGKFKKWWGSSFFRALRNKA
ncbi:hypothetical protein E1B28_003729 [Marasmius oreades]|uniref:Uncharacterized protein n=1 Tax=Marasmius oreades TaxID=181124 RepID=A0A9P8AB60_9AGAR|nr:uncharacterized protein E1B28_003729 [Marasmius oreades]KAG7096282.1 hypothetical protein E1B28_003729 [Marasmius oreades]